MTTENVVTPEQHKFYSELQTNYNEYKSKMTPIIEDTFKNAIDNFSIVDFDKEFKLTTIMIPDFNENLWFGIYHLKRYTTLTTFFQLTSMIMKQLMYKLTVKINWQTRKLCLN